MKRTAYVAVVFVALAGIIGFAVRSGPWGSNAQSSGDGGSVAAGSGEMADRAVPAPLPSRAGDVRRSPRCHCPSSSHRPPSPASAQR
jgi:hypothetical protein